MLARLWWKEGRTFWPLAAMIVALAVAFQALLLDGLNVEARSGLLTPVALGWACLYALAIGCAAFAGERESRTLLLLDTLPLGRKSLWLGKFTFAAGSTLLLAVLLIAIAANGTTERNADQYGLSMVLNGYGVLVFESLAWSLLWSAWLSNPLTAAILAMFSVMVVQVAVSPGMPIVDIEAVAKTAPSRLLAALAALAASLWLLARVPRRQVVLRPSMSHAAQTQRVATEARARYGGYGSYIPFATIRSLVWQTLREARALWALVTPLIVVGGAIFCGWVGYRDGRGMIFFMGLLASLALGVSVFGTENRVRAFRFCVHHGVRPGWLWSVKIVVWGSIFASLVLCVILFVAPSPNLRAEDVALLAAMVPAFAMGQLCGMVVSRGITAGVLALLGCIVVTVPHYGLVGAGMAPWWTPVFPPLILLGISWSWSGDWILERPAPWRWVRLGLLVVVPFGILVGSYAGYRAWSVPDIGPVVRLSELSFPAPASEKNGADLYRRASAAIQPFSQFVPNLARHPLDELQLQQVIEKGWKFHTDAVVHALEANRPAIALAREAASRPRVAFQSLGALDKPRARYLSDPNMLELCDYIEIEIRERMSRGDLAGAWDDVRLLLRMAQQFSEGAAPVWQTLSAYDFCHGRAMRQGFPWLADSRLTLEQARAALADVQRLALHSPETTIKIEQYRDERLLALPRAQLETELANERPRGGSRSFSLLWRIVNGVVVDSPWERERTRRMLRIITARAVQAAQNVSVLTLDAPFDAMLPLIRTTPLLDQFHPFLTQHILQRYIACVCDSRAFELIAALRIWQFEHQGAYPESLDALVPSLLARVPIDPYAISQRPFQYAHAQGQEVLPLSAVGMMWTEHDRPDPVPTEVGQWLLYSVGPDRNDDQARASYGSSDFNRGDVIYLLPNKEQAPPPR